MRRRRADVCGSHGGEDRGYDICPLYLVAIFQDLVDDGWIPVVQVRRADDPVRVLVDDRAQCLDAIADGEGMCGGLRDLGVRQILCSTCFGYYWCFSNNN